MIKICKTDIRRINIGGKTKYIIDKYAFYSKFTNMDYFEERTGYIESKLFFCPELAKDDLRKRWDKLIKEVEQETTFGPSELTDMDPRRFNMVYNVRKLKKV